MKIRKDSRTKGNIIKQKQKTKTKRKKKKQYKQEKSQNMEDTERDGKKGIYKQRKQTSINYTKLVTKKINKNRERTEKKKKKDDQRKLKILSKTSKYSIRM